MYIVCSSTCLLRRFYSFLSGLQVMPLINSRVTIIHTFYTYQVYSCYGERSHILVRNILFRSKWWYIIVSPSSNDLYIPVWLILIRLKVIHTYQTLKQPVLVCVLYLSDKNSNILMSVKAQLYMYILIGKIWSKKSHTWVIVIPFL